MVAPRPGVPLLGIVIVPATKSVGTWGTTEIGLLLNIRLFPSPERS